MLILDPTGLAFVALWLISIAFVPPLLLSFTFEAWWLRPPGAQSPAPLSEILAAWGLTVIGTGVGMTAAAVVSPSLVRAMLLKELWLGTILLPLSPAAFVAVGVATAAVVFVLMPAAGLTGRCNRRGRDRSR
jgi:hypothetical protein